MEKRRWVRHYKVVGREREEIADESEVPNHTHCDCPACRMERVIATFGGDNLK